MSIRERSSVDKDCPVHQASSCNRHPARCGLDDLRVLEYQRHGESGDNESACEEVAKVRICAVEIVWAIDEIVCGGSGLAMDATMAEGREVVRESAIPRQTAATKPELTNYTRVIYHRLPHTLNRWNSARAQARM